MISRLGGDQTTCQPCTQFTVVKLIEFTQKSPSSSERYLAASSSTTPSRWTLTSDRTLAQHVPLSDALPDRLQAQLGLVSRPLPLLPA